MDELKDLLQTADWKKEKHVPVIDLPEKMEKNEAACIGVSVGKEVSHPNKTEHHIAWIELLFLPKDGKFPYVLGHCNFSSHGASTDGADTSGVYAEPCTCFSLKTETPGTLIALSYCNIHGLWTSSEDLTLS